MTWIGGLGGGGGLSGVTALDRRLPSGAGVAAMAGSVAAMLGVPGSGDSASFSPGGGTGASSVTSCAHMIRYICADLEQVGTELARHAAEMSHWLDARAAAASTRYRESVADQAAKASAEVDLICYQTLTAAVLRLTAAATELAGCASDMRHSDAAVAYALTCANGSVNRR